MRILQEKLEKETFIDIVLNRKELRDMTDLQIIWERAIINGVLTEIGIRLALDTSDDEKGELIIEDPYTGNFA